MKSCSKSAARWKGSEVGIPAMRISSSARRIRAIDSAHRENAHVWPFFLPDGKHFLFITIVSSRERDRLPLRVSSLDSPDEATTIGEVASRVEYAQGHLLQVREGVLVAQPFDLRTMRIGSEPTTLDISGRDLGALIGWRGETLRALQSVTNVMVGRHLGEGERIIVDVERYRQRREHTVREIALRAARQVKMTGDAITLDAMQPFERRAIHLALEGDPEVTSSSIGEEPERRVVVGLRKPGPA